MQELLRTEFSSILRTVKEPEYADIERLPYVDNFLREVLRVYCPGMSHNILRGSEGEVDRFQLLLFLARLLATSRSRVLSCLRAL